MAVIEQWGGKGTSEEPFIIESDHSLPLRSIIKDSSFFIVVRNSTFISLTLNKCKNIRFERCIFEVLQLINCSDIIINQ